MPNRGSAPEPVGEVPSSRNNGDLEYDLVYRLIVGNVFQKSTSRLITARKVVYFHAGKRFSADYHQKSSDKGPNHNVFEQSPELNGGLT